jgi:hypothetical protein
MTSENCPVCRGRKTITLPLHSPVTVVLDAIPPEISAASSRDYPCPECSEQVAIERVGIVKQRGILRQQIKVPDYRKHVEEVLARKLGEELAKRGYITFSEVPRPLTDDGIDDIALCAVIGVLAPTGTISLEERAAEKQDEFAAEAAKLAEKAICNWGSDYGETHILKDRAIAEIHGAIKMVKARRRGSLK